MGATEVNVSFYQRQQIRKGGKGAAGFPVGYQNRFSKLESTGGPPIAAGAETDFDGVYSSAPNDPEKISGKS